MDAISFADARADFEAVMDRVVADRIPLAITRRKQDSVVLIAASEWASIEETLYPLQSPASAGKD